MGKKQQQSRTDSGSVNICIAGAASYVPPARVPVAGILAAEMACGGSVEKCGETASRLGIEYVHACGDKLSSDLASTAAKQALEQAGTSPAEIDVIVDFTSLPEDYVVPAWSMANKLQHDLTAVNAFTLGFSGGANANLLVAVKFTAALLEQDPNINTALLFAGERAVAGKRVLDPTCAVTVCGDGGSALVLKKTSSVRKCVLGTSLWSEGKMHDAFRIPAGGFVRPVQYDEYKLVLDTPRFEAFSSKQSKEIFIRLADELLSPRGLDFDAIRYLVCPNISVSDRKSTAGAFGFGEDRLADGKLGTYGHIQSSDLIINYLSAVSSGQIAQGDYILFCSHGFGFTWGVTLLRY